MAVVAPVVLEDLLVAPIVLVALGSGVVVVSALSGVDGLGYVGLVVSIELGVLVVAVLEVGFVTAAVLSGLGLGAV